MRKIPQCFLAPVTRSEKLAYDQAQKCGFLRLITIQHYHLLYQLNTDRGSYTGNARKFSIYRTDISARYKVFHKVCGKLVHIDHNMVDKRWIGRKSFPQAGGKLVHIDHNRWKSGGQISRILTGKNFLSPIYTQLVHRQKAVFSRVGNFTQRAGLALEAVLSYGHCPAKNEVCRLIHFSTGPTTTVLYISFKIYIDNNNRGRGKVDKSDRAFKILFLL